MTLETQVILAHLAATSRQISNPVRGNANSADPFAHPPRAVAALHTPSRGATRAQTSIKFTQHVPFRRRRPVPNLGKPFSTRRFCLNGSGRGDGARGCLLTCLPSAYQTTRVLPILAADLAGFGNKCGAHSRGLAGDTHGPAAWHGGGGASKHFPSRQRLRCCQCAKLALRRCQPRRSGRKPYALPCAGSRERSGNSLAY